MIDKETGAYTYTVDNNSAAVQALGVGELIVKTFTYTASDGLTDTADLTVTITGTNDGPVAATNTDSVIEDDDLTATGNVITNDTDVDGDGLSVTAVNGGAIGPSIPGTYGSLNMAANGVYTYTLTNGHPAVQALGVGELLTDQFTYTITDGNGGTSTTTLSITINGDNDDVTLAPQTADATEDLLAEVDGNVLEDVLDLDVNDVHTVIGVVAGAGPAPTNGTGVSPTVIVGTYGDLTISATGEATYTLRNGDANVQALAAGQTEQDAFSFAVSDGEGSITQASLTFNVHGTNDAPIAVADIGPALQTNEDTPFNFDVRTNDTDVDGTVTAVSKINGVAPAVGVPIVVTGGTVTLEADGTLTFDPAPDSTLDGSFSYQVIDDMGAEFAPASVTIDVVPVNDAPVAQDEVAGIAEDVDTDPALGVQSAVSGNLLANDDDGDAGVTDDLDVTAVSGPGALVIDNATTLTRTDADGSLVIDKETGAYTYTVDNTSAAVQALGLGELITKTFTYTVSDGLTDTADLTVTITGTNDGPVAVANTDSVTEDVDLTATGNVITNDFDVDGDTPTVSAVNGGAIGPSIPGTYGTLNMAATGVYTYTLTNGHPAVQALGVGELLIDQFTYTITDGNGGTSTTTLNIAINGDNDAVTLAPQTSDVTEDLVAEVHGNVLDDVADVDVNDVHTVVGVTTGAGPAPTDNTGVGLTIVGTYGNLVIDANGEATYTLRNGDANVQGLAAGQTEQDAFTFAVSDGNGSIAQASLTFDVNGANDAPVAAADSLATNEDTSVTLDILANDTDVDGAGPSIIASINGVAISVGQTVAVIGGTVTLNAAGFVDDMGTASLLDDVTYANQTSPSRRVPTARSMRSSPTRRRTGSGRNPARRSCRSTSCR